MVFTKEEQLELTQLLGPNERWGGEAVLQQLKEATYFDKSFDHPLDSNKLSRKNPTVNDKYITLLKVFFAIREGCHKGNLGTNSKGKLKDLKSIEKFEKVFMLRFTNCRPQFYSFKKAAELTGLTVEDMHKIEAKPTYDELGNKKYQGIRFDITDFFSLIEEPTKADWEQDIYATTLFTTKEESLIYRDIFYQDKMMQLKEHYCIRRLFTYESERVNPSSIDYAELTPEGKLLPDWFVHFKQDTFKTLKRKEQLVAFFNNYDERYDSTVDYQVGKPTQEAITIHLSKTYQPKGKK